MEGTVQVASAPVAAEASSTTSAPSKTSSSENYSVSDSDLSELGISLDDDSGDSGEDSSFEYGNVSANPKIQKESTDDSLDFSDDDTDENAPAKDEWLDAIKKDLEIDDSSTVDPSKPNDPLALKEIEIERFGVKHKLPFSEAQKLIQQGYDYTQKTQTLAEEKRSFEMSQKSQIESFEKERAQFQQQLNEKEQLDYFVESLRSSDPDFYQELEKRAGAFRHQVSNPFFEKHLQAQTRQIEELKNQLSAQQKNDLRSSFNREYEALLSMHNSKYAKLGVKIDEKAIQNEWVNSGDPLKNIYKKLYADKILSLAQSRGVLEKKVKASSNRAPTMGRLKATGSQRPEVKSQIKKMSYHQIADAVMKGQMR